MADGVQPAVAPILTGPQLQAVLRALPDRELWLMRESTSQDRNGATRRLFHAELRALRRAEGQLARAYASSLIQTPGGPAREEGDTHG